MVDFDRSAVTTNLGGGKGGRRVVLGEGTDERFLGWSPGNKPDGSGVAEKGIGRGDPPDSEFRDKIGCHQELFLFEGGGFGKEGRGVAVISNPEKDQIKAGGVAKVVPDLFFICTGTDFGGSDFGMNPFDVNPCSMEGLLNHSIVAVFVVGGDPSFVSQVEAGGGPGPFQFRKALVERFRSGASREGYVEGAPGLEGRTSEGFPSCNHGVHPSGGV
jgi:hypothetical protein